MKKYPSKTKWLIFLLALILLQGCSKRLNEELYGTLSPANYYRTEEEALSSVVGVYQRMSSVVDIGNAYRNSELGTDEFIVPARTNGGWFDGGIWIQYITHNVTPDNVINNGAWSSIFGVIGAANAVIQSIEESPQASNLTAVLAEVRALRAYAYFYAMDFWGNVPIVTVARIDPSDLPKNNTRAEVFTFVESEMIKAAADLPSVTTVNRTAYYPRFTKEAIYSALATLYLNAKVYNGTDKWTQAIEMCDKVIATNAYKLESSVLISFKGDNDKSQEIISSFSIDPTQQAGGNQFILYSLNALTKAVYNLPFTPANGFSTFEEALNRYEANDARRKYIYYGPQTYANGDPVKYSNGTPLVLVPIKDYTNAEDNEGYKVLKYLPDGTIVSNNANNDLVLMRYADILLIKAEALLRTGKPAEALPLVNAVRSRSNATPLVNLSLQNMEDERGREFIWEGTRRRDMIRFGDYFTGTWKFKTAQDPPTKGLYPIPSQQLIANKNLVQNPGY